MLTHAPLGQPLAYAGGVGRIGSFERLERPQSGYQMQSLAPVKEAHACQGRGQVKRRREHARGSEAISLATGPEEMQHTVSSQVVHHLRAAAEVEPLATAAHANVLAKIEPAIARRVKERTGSSPQAALGFQQGDLGPFAAQRFGRTEPRYASAYDCYLHGVWAILLQGPLVHSLGGWQQSGREPYASG